MTTLMRVRVIEGASTSILQTVVAGLQGATGASAYDIWVDHGGVGTEQDFLDSLVGATGPQGPEGAGTRLYLTQNYV